MLDCFLLSKFECPISLSNIEFPFRIANFEYRVDGDIFEEGPCLDADFFERMQKDAFSERSGYVWRRPQ